LPECLSVMQKGIKRIKETVDLVLKKLGAGPEVLFSTLGRTAARAIETQVIVNRLPKWVDMLVANIKSGDYSAHNGENGIQKHGQNLQRASAGMKHQGVHLDTGL